MCIVWLVLLNGWGDIGLMVVFPIHVTEIMKVEEEVAANNDHARLDSCIISVIF